MNGLLEFSSLRQARSFAAGFVRPRVVVRLARFRYAVVHPDTARRNGWKVQTMTVPA